MAKGRITVRTEQLKRADYSKHVYDAVLIRFMNRGQNYVFIDEQIILEPGEAFVEGDLNGPGLLHKYRIEFLTNSSPPAANSPIVYSGNHLEIRIFKRTTDHARK